ncbi:hypothetical protein SAG0066_00790 [Streptococcus agalactiae CCUG 38383]|nr:hypothetical protein SAG0066_00790 [Streptococcus agalactiae CCUG 38383]
MLFQPLLYQYLAVNLLVKLADSLVYQASRTVRADFMKGFGNMQLGSDSDTDMFMPEEVW